MHKHADVNHENEQVSLQELEGFCKTCVDVFPVILEHLQTFL